MKYTKTNAKKRVKFLNNASLLVIASVFAMTSSALYAGFEGEDNPMDTQAQKVPHPYSLPSSFNPNQYLANNPGLAERFYREQSKKAAGPLSKALHYKGDQLSDPTWIARRNNWFQALVHISVTTEKEKGLAWLPRVPGSFDFNTYRQLNPELDARYVREQKARTEKARREKTPLKSGEYLLESDLSEDQSQIISDFWKAKRADWLQRQMLAGLQGNDATLPWIKGVPPEFNYGTYLEINPTLGERFIRENKLREGQGLRNGQLVDFHLRARRALWLQNQVIASLQGKDQALPWIPGLLKGFDWQFILKNVEDEIVEEKVGEVATELQRALQEVIDKLVRVYPQEHGLKTLTGPQRDKFIAAVGQLFKTKEGPILLKQIHRVPLSQMDLFLQIIKQISASPLPGEQKQGRLEVLSRMLEVGFPLAAYEALVTAFGPNLLLSDGFYSENEIFEVLQPIPPKHFEHISKHAKGEPDQQAFVLRDVASLYEQQQHSYADFLQTLLVLGAHTDDSWTYRDLAKNLADVSSSNYPALRQVIQGFGPVSGDELIILLGVLSEIPPSDYPALGRVIKGFGAVSDSDLCLLVEAFQQFPPAHWPAAQKATCKLVAETQDRVNLLYSLAEISQTYPETFDSSLQGLAEIGIPSDEDDYDTYWFPREVFKCFSEIPAKYYGQIRGVVAGPQAPENPEARLTILDRLGKAYAEDEEEFSKLLDVIGLFIEGIEKEELEWGLWYGLSNSLKSVEKGDLPRLKDAVRKAAGLSGGNRVEFFSNLVGFYKEDKDKTFAFVEHFGEFFGDVKECRPLSHTLSVLHHVEPQHFPRLSAIAKTVKGQDKWPLLEAIAPYAYAWGKPDFFPDLLDLISEVFSRADVDSWESAQPYLDTIKMVDPKRYAEAREHLVLNDIRFDIQTVLLDYKQPDWYSDEW